jgi:hypothetical protein
VLHPIKTRDGFAMTGGVQDRGMLDSGRRFMELFVIKKQQIQPFVDETSKDG